MTPSSAVLVQYTADAEEVPQDVQNPSSVLAMSSVTGVSTGTSEQRTPFLGHTVTQEASQRLHHVQNDRCYGARDLPRAHAAASLDNHGRDKDVFGQLRPFPHRYCTQSAEQASRPVTFAPSVEGPTYYERRLAPVLEPLSAQNRGEVLHGRVQKDASQAHISTRPRSRRSRGGRFRAGRARRI